MLGLPHSIPSFRRTHYKCWSCHSQPLWPPFPAPSWHLACPPFDFSWNPSRLLDSSCTSHLSRLSHLPSSACIAHPPHLLCDIYHPCHPISRLSDICHRAQLVCCSSSLHDLLLWNIGRGSSSLSWLEVYSSTGEYTRTMHLRTQKIERNLLLIFCQSMLDCEHSKRWLHLLQFKDIKTTTKAAETS